MAGTETEVVDVIFRVDREGEVFALFPGLAGTRELHTCTSYQHVGQHGSADLAFCMRSSRKATEDEYMPLMRELQRVGYAMNVVAKTSRRHAVERAREVHANH
jgi:hypothetical protein